MALKEQVSNVYGVGLRNVGSYQVSGTPWVTGSAIANTIVQEHDLPTVSKSFTFINTGGDPCWSILLPGAQQFQWICICIW